MSAKAVVYNLVNAFFNNAVATPENSALWVDGCDYSYKEISAAAFQSATWLADRYTERAHVGILASRHLEPYIGVLAALWCGHLYVPLSPNQPISYLRSIIKNAEIDCIIIDDSCQKLIDSGLLEGMAVDVFPVTLPEDADGAWPSFPPVPVLPNHPAYIMYTSGSTGTPKGIAATAANVRHFLQATQKRYQLRASDRLSQFNDLHWDPSVFDLFSAWEVGASVHVVPAGQLLFPTRFIQEHELTVWYSIPSQITMLDRGRLLKPGVLPSLRLSLFVGEPLTATMAATWQEAAPNSLVENVYGPTETTVVCTGQPFSNDPDCITDERGYVALGTPYDGMILDVIDPVSSKFVHPGSPGEIVITGPQMTPGYWHDPAKTAEKFVDLDHPDLGTRRWYLTGDQGYRTPENRFHFLGRIDNQVQVHGKRVELEEVESHLRQVTELDQVAVVAWPIIDGSAQNLYGFVEGPGSENDLKKSLRERLPLHMVPKRVFFLEDLPRNRNGKIDRKTLVRQLDDEQHG